MQPIITTHSIYANTYIYKCNQNLRDYTLEVHQIAYTMPTPHNAHVGWPLADNGRGASSCCKAAAAACISALYSGPCNAGHTGIMMTRGSAGSDDEGFADCARLARCAEFEHNFFSCKFVPMDSSCGCSSCMGCWCLWDSGVRCSLPPMAWLWVQ